MYRRNRYARRGCRCNCPNCAEIPVCPENPELANSYTPYQYLNNVFCPCEALIHGTAFPELATMYQKNESQCINKYLSQTKTCEEVDACGE